MKMDRKLKAGSRSKEVKANGKSRSVSSKPASKSNSKHPLVSYEHVPIGVVEASLEGKFLNVNEEFCRITGYERQELLQLNIKDITHEEDYTFDIQLYERLIAGKIPYYKIEKRLNCKEGGVVWVEMTRSLVRGPRGAARHSVGAVLDISDRKHVERVLRESVERQRLATEAAQMFTWEWNFQTQLYTLSDSFVQVLGFSGALLPQNNIEDVFKLIPTEDVQQIREAVDRAVENHSDLHSLQYRMFNPEHGETVWLEMNGKTVYDEQGKAVRMFGVAQNITENKKAEGALEFARSQAEQSADRTARLQKITAALSAALTPPQVAEVLASEGGPAFGAVSSSMMILSEDGQSLEIMYSTSPESLVRSYKHFPVSLNVPAAEAVRSRQPVWIESQQQYLERYPHLADHIKLWGHQAAIAIPMELKERILGVLTMSFDRVLVYNLDDQDYALTLARQGAQALERARAENALRESEERFRALVSQATAGISQSDLSNHLVFVNPQFCEMLGYSKSELLEKTIWELTHPDDLEENRRLFEQMISHGESYQFEKRFVRRDGSFLWANVSVSPIRDTAGKPKGGVSVIVDITERKRIEDDLRESEERYRFIVENTSDGIWRIELEEPMPVSLPEEQQIEWYYRHAVLRQCNLGLARMYGYASAEEVAGLPLRILMPPEDPVNLELTRRFIRSGYRLVDAESREMGEDGRELVFLNNMIGLVEDGKLKGEWGTNRDITERKRSEEALAEFARQQEALHKLSDQLHRTDTQEDVFEVALDAIMNALQCDRASILLFDQTDKMRFVAWRGLSDSYRRATDGHSPWGRDAIEPEPICMEDVRTAELDESLRAVIEKEGIGSLAFIPLVSSGKLIGKFMAYFNAPHRLSADEVELGLTIANNLAFGIERKRAEQALRQSEERYRAVVESQVEMLCRFQIDGRILFANSAYAQARGTTPDVLMNRNFWEFIPEEDHQAVRAMLDTLTPEAPEVQIENRFETAEGERWTLWTNRALTFDANGRLLEAQSSGIDITERKQAENRLALLAGISDMLRNFQDPYELMYEVSKAVGEHFRVKRVLFNEIDLEHDRELVRSDYHNGLPSVVGVHKLSAYSSVTSAEVAAGRTVVNADSKTDPRTAQDYGKTYALSGERSYVVVPMMRENEWVASLWVSDDVPRNWSPEEVSLMETVAERTWTVIEKLQINTALQESEQRFREIFETAGVSVWLEDFTEVKDEVEELRSQGIRDFRAYFRENPGFVQRAISLVRVLDVNNETLDLFRARNKEDLLGSLSKVFAPETEEIFIEELIALTEGHETLRSETQVRALDGSPISVLFTVHLGSRSDDHSHVVVTLTDITERKQAEDVLRIRARQQQAVAKLGELALRERDLQKVFDHATDSIAQTLEIEYCKVLELLESGDALLLRAGVGWQEGLVGTATVGAGLDSQAGFTLRAAAPIIVDDLHQEQRFNGPPLLFEHGVVSGMSCIILGVDGNPWGVLGAHTTRRTAFTEDDVNFLVAVANILGDAIHREQSEQALRASESLYRALARNIPGGGVYVVDKDFRYIIAEGPVTEAFGLTREMLEGHTVAEVFPGERGARMEERLRRNFAGETMGFETKHNGRVYWTQQAPLHDSIGQAIILTLDITERKQVEEALRQSEERFARFMQHLPGLAWIKDMEGRYVYANAAAESAFNTPIEKLYGRTDEEIFPPEVAAQFRRNDEQALQSETGMQVIETLEQNDGILHYSLVSKFPIPGPDDSTTLIGGTAFDITERRKAEEGLRESEERFRAILTQATAGIVRKDVDGRLIFVNEAFCNMLGYPEAELLGKTVWEFMHPEDIAENKQLYERLILEGIPFNLERRFLRQDGSVIWVDASVSPVMDAEGKLQSAVAVEVDITGRKQAEDALRASEQRFRNLFDLVPVAVYSCDAEGLIDAYNHRAVELWGREPGINNANEKYCGSYKIFYPDGRFMSHEQCPMARALQGEILEPHEFEILVEREDGVRRNVVAHPLILRNEFGEITGAINCLYDITERKQAEEALHQLNLQLENRVQQRTARLNDAIQTLRDEIAERRKVEEALRRSEATARENEEKLSTLFDLLPVGISFLDLKGQTIQTNPALESILKLPKEKEQLSEQVHTSRQYIRPNGTLMPPSEFASQRALSEHRTVYNVETGIVLEDGAVIWTSVSAAPVSVADVGAVVVTVDITEGKRAERALQESRERLQILSQRLVEVQEEERRAIARELHDRVGQTLAALNINLIIINSQVADKVDEQVSARLSDSMKLVTETITLVRDVMSNLRPAVLDDYGLEAALQSYLDEYRRRYQIKVVMDKSDSPIPRLGSSIEMTFLRIAQEALMNVARHAQASHATLSLREDDGTVCMTVQDNGVGIPSGKESRRPGSHGLTIMRERAEAFGGTLEVTSTPGQGTRVMVNIPVESDPLPPREKEQLL